MDEVLKFANYVAALTVCKFGAMPSLPTLDEVVEFMKSRNETLPNLERLR